MLLAGVRTRGLLVFVIAGRTAPAVLVYAVPMNGSKQEPVFRPPVTPKPNALSIQLVHFPAAPLIFCRQQAQHQSAQA
jgi:hypothetical protein